MAWNGSWVSAQQRRTEGVGRVVAQGPWTKVLRNGNSAMTITVAVLIVLRGKS
eukprot:CAMPEP_0195043100 /NCGR_PEP_ID=MMETSP0347-20130606/3729_1 /TAXON_ID=2932 /ORGANISM="Alexandrium fundyense, Strain CCMP1719" /LENGTH=52 /DNA_ID=CAMNT_0040070459 /DNA_START=9 /DNA_END=164 /DNA_ORIENTATION=-